MKEIGAFLFLIVFVGGMSALATSGAMIMNKKIGKAIGSAVEEYQTHRRAEMQELVIEAIRNERRKDPQ